MSDIAIRVEGISKHYRLGTIGAATLQDDLRRWWARTNGRPDPLQPLGDNARQSRKEHWALRNVSFDVRRGEVLGIIGRNGAGKSTLLKILSRTTAPTTGRALVNGRIGSLLEVGTGFHPELSGRENIYLNGSILGMRRHEIHRKLDEIIEFSGIDRFIDTPVKRYSSGMYVRLAFAVAAHLEPEILIMDEVLAVGDSEFQKKCLGKMKDVAGHGRTVIFVSHNISAVRSLCTMALLMHQGTIVSHDDTALVIAQYVDDGQVPINSRSWPGPDRPGDDTLQLERVWTDFQSPSPGDAEGEPTLAIKLMLAVGKDQRDVDIGISLTNAKGEYVIDTSLGAQHARRHLRRGRSMVSYSVPAHCLGAGTHAISVTAAIPNQRLIFDVTDALSFKVAFETEADSFYSSAAWRGALSPMFGTWAVSEQENDPCS